MTKYHQLLLTQAILDAHTALEYLNNFQFELSRTAMQTALRQLRLIEADEKEQS